MYKGDYAFRMIMKGNETVMNNSDEINVMNEEPFTYTRQQMW